MDLESKRPRQSHELEISASI